MAAIKAESYEICEYESLIDMAQEMQHTKVAQLLGQTSKEEKATLNKDEGIQRAGEAEAVRRTTRFKSMVVRA